VLVLWISHDSDASSFIFPILFGVPVIAVSYALWMGFRGVGND
jgi:hypothetical protein